MERILSRYKDAGFFDYKSGADLKKLCRNLNKKGVYLIYRTTAANKDELVYIGKSGTLYQNGWSKQTLQGRIPNKVGKDETRQQFFERKFVEEKILNLKIRWYTTFDDSELFHVPSYTEALLLQKYYDEYRRLPEWNNEF